MPINLTKGQKVELTKGNPSLKKLMVGLAGIQTAMTEEQTLI